MEQMITNIWSMNLLLGGIILFLCLAILLIFLVLGVILYPFKRKDKEYE